MRELMLKFDYEYIDITIEQYLLSLKGIENVEIDNLNNQIYIKYNSNDITIKVIKLEIMLFLGIKIPDIIAFDKYSRARLNNISITIKDLCCEYCLKSTIEELLLIKGIEKVSTNFDYVNKKDVAINIDYDSDLITKEEIINLENKFNNNEENKNE